MSDDKITYLFNSTATLAELDLHISQALLDFAKTHQISNSDIAGVFESIKFRMFNEGI